MNKTLVFVMLGMFMLSFATALEFDNVKSYDRNSKTITIDNGFGLLGEIAEVQLKTDLVQVVPIGYQKVAEFEVTMNRDYTQSFKEMEFYDKLKNNERFVRDFDYKYLVEETTTVQDYETVCSNNKTCERVNVGSHKVTKQVWYDLSDSNFIDDQELTIGIFTEVKEGDYVEWIPNFFGVRIDEWAVWTASLEVDLLTWYKLDQSSGVVLDSVGEGVFNATNVGSARGITGIINNSFNLTRANGDNIFLDDNFSISDFPFSFSGWFNTNLSGSEMSLFGMNSRTTGLSNGINYVVNVNGGDNLFILARDDVSTDATGTSESINDGSWHNVIVVFEDATDRKLYLDGVSILNQTTSVTYNDNNMQFIMGAQNATLGNFFDGGIDEVGVWNRSLSLAEVVQLYNNGQGITIVNVPLITLNDPLNNSNFSSSNVTFNATIGFTSGGPNIIVNVSLFIDGTFNETNTSGVIGDYLFEKNLSDGTHTWFIVATDISNVSTNSSIRTFNIDTVAPLIVIEAPVGLLGSSFIGSLETLNFTATDTTLDQCWFDYNGTNITIEGCLTGIKNSTTFTLEDNNFNLTVYANDSLGQESSAFTSWSYTFFESAEIFNASVFETSLQTFTINITTLPSVLSLEGVLNYNGTRFTAETTCVSNICTIDTMIDIPLISNLTESLSFLWELTAFNATSSFQINTSSSIQNVTQIFLEFCNATITTEALNFTAFDEQNLSAVDPFTFAADFEFWLGTGSVTRTSNLTDSSASSVDICISPGTEDFTVDGVVEYDEAVGSIYTIRNYYFQNDIVNNISQDIGLGLLKTSDSTSFILRVQDADILPLPDALIFTQRFYPGLGEFRTVQVAKTDDNGKSVGFFEVETADYRFIIKKNGVTLLITPADNRSQKVVGEETPFTLTFTVGADEGASWEVFEPVDSLTSSLEYNVTSQIISFTYVDTSADFDLALLQVFSVNTSANDVLVCNVSQTQSSGIISCNMTGNATGNYIAKGLIFRDDVRILASQIIFTIQEFTDVTGRLGLFLGWFVILIGAFAFKFNEIAGIIMLNVTMIFVNLIKLVNFSITMITAWIALSILILVVLER